MAWRNGTPVRLEQVANVIDSVEDDKNASMFYDKSGSRKAINLMVMKQPGANTIQTNDEIKQLLPVDPGATAALGGDQDPQRPLEDHPRGFPRHPVHHGWPPSGW